MGRRNRLKGKTFERTIAKSWREAIGPARRGMQMQGGDVAADVEVEPIRIECKNLNRIAAFRHFESVMKDAQKASDARRCVVVMKEHGCSRALALVEWEFLLELLAERHRHQSSEESNHA